MTRGTKLVIIPAVLLMTVCTTPATALTVSNVNRSGYSVVNNGLNVGAVQFIDRAYTFSGVPTAYRNKTYIKTANDDRGSTGDSFLTFDIDQDCTVYVAHDDRLSNPSWMTDFVDTTAHLISSDNSNTFSLYGKVFPAGTVVLGGNYGNSTVSMYSVVIVPVPLTGPPSTASNPSPPSTQTNVPIATILSWTAGTEATSHDVYFGETNPPAFVGNQAGTTYDPGELELGTTFYWRIDEVNSLGTTTGTVWSFTTEITSLTTIAAGWWRFDESMGSTARDSSANMNDGTLLGMDNSDWVAGQFGNALDFDGINDYVQMPSVSILESGSQLVAEAWVKTTAISPQFGTIMGTGDAGWVVARQNNGMTAGFWMNTGLLIVQNNFVIINDGQWHHVAVVYDGSAAYLYVDGTVTSNDQKWGGGTITPGGSLQSSGYSVHIGKNPYTEASVPSEPRYWNGLIDEVKIYNDADEYVYHLNNPNEAWGPSPSDGKPGVAVDSLLSWSGGDNAISHDIYFGTNETAVMNAQRLAGDVNGDGTVNTDDLVKLAEQWLSNPGAVNPSADVKFNGSVDLGDFATVAADWGLSADPEFKGNQSDPVFDPGTLTEGVTYYWRVDEVNASDPDSPWTGRVWSFAATSPVSGGDIVFPGATWQTKAPAELGLDGAKLDQFAANVGGVGCIVRQGYMVKTWGDPSAKDFWASASKPVTSTLLLYAVEEGLLTDVHELIKDHGWTMSTQDQTMEFYHLANMTSGYARTEGPGEAWAYNDYAIRLYVETLFDNVYGATANAVATSTSRLGALGFEDGTIYQDHIISGTNYGPSVYASPRDFARIGWFWLNRGYWDGQQLLPRHYFDDYMKTLVPSSLPLSTASDSDYLSVGTYGGGSYQTDYGPGLYGFNWWFNENLSHWPDAPEDTFQANGHWGREVVTVIPSLSLVVAWRMSAWPDSSYFQPGSSSSPMNQNLKLLVEGCPPVQQVLPGAIVKDPDHPAWLKRYDGNHLFMCGPGDPENFLYRGTRNADGTRNGDQMDLINKLAPTGANCIYFQAVKTNGGDNNGDPYMNPFVDGNVNGLLNEDILNQWETWFTAMDDNNIVIFFMFYDDYANPFGGGDTMPAQEIYMVDELVNRFEHHKNLIWIVSEEYNKVHSTTRISNIAARIKSADDYDHAVGTHQLPSTSFDFNGDANMDQFAMQLNDATTSYVHQSCLNAWSNVGGLKNVNLAEIYEWNTIPQTGAALRQKAWAAAMGGAYSMWLWMDIASTPVSDLQICGRVVTFMESTKFYMTQPSDSLKRGTTDYVLADPGNVYIVYSDLAGTQLGVNVLAGDYSVKWYDPIDGDWSDQGTQTIAAGDRYFTRPSNISSTEAVLYLEAQVQAAEILPNDDCTTLYGENKNNDAGGELGLFVKYANIYSWIEFTLGSTAVNQATLILQQDDADLTDLWTITVKGTEYNFNETTFTGIDASGWTDIGSIPNVSDLGTFTLDMTTFYNNNLGKTVTLRLYRADPQPAGSGPIFQDRELTRQFWWSTDEGPKISVQ